MDTTPGTWIDGGGSPLALVNHPLQQILIRVSGVETHGGEAATSTGSLAWSWALDDFHPGVSQHLLARLNRSFPNKAYIRATRHSRRPAQPRRVPFGMHVHLRIAHLDGEDIRFTRTPLGFFIDSKAKTLVERDQTSGALAVMAHPGLNRSDDMIPALVEAGLDGLECFHSKHSTPVTEHYMQLADRYNLLVTGGSDCHGKSKGKPLIGTIKVPYAHVEGLKARRRAKGHLPNPPPPPSPDAAQDPSGPDQP
jgi:hypothetical protein